MSERKYDSTVARIAGNLLSGIRLWTAEGKPLLSDRDRRMLAGEAVALARSIVDETKRTEPQPPA
jgi:hypothetical protein